MIKALLSETTEAKKAVTALFRDSPPVLVEVRFPGCGTSPDWHLCEDEGQLEAILATLAQGAEVRLSSVWDLRNEKGELVVRK